MKYNLGQYYEKLKETKSFKKLLEKVKKDDEPNELFDKATESEIEEEIRKAKTKLISKKEKVVYIAKYDKYFPIDEPIFIHCDYCNSWRKISSSLGEKLKKKSKVSCEMMNLKCKKSKKKG